MNMNHKIILVLACLLIVIGLFKPDLSNLGFSPNRPVAIDVLELSIPTDVNVKKEADDVVNLLKETGTSVKVDARKLRDLYLDLAKLVELDDTEMVVANTEEIRQANSLAGIMLRLDIKGKYPNLAKEAKEVIVASIGDDKILLSKELRAKAVDGFNALAWACNEGSK
jgi:hypothetical protein